MEVGVDDIALFLSSFVTWKIFSRIALPGHSTGKLHQEQQQNLRPSLKHVAIIGSGVGGLGAAIALQMQGIKCTVYERDSKFEDRRQGYGMTLSSSENGPLAKLGILDECLRVDCASYCHWIFEPSGNIIGYYGRAFKDDKFHGSAPSSVDDFEQDVVRRRGGGNLRIPRELLRRLLLNRLAPNTVQWGKRFHSCSSCCSGEHPLQVKFADGSSIGADLLVGSDGIKSLVRVTRDQIVGESTGQQKKKKKKSTNSDTNQLKYLGVSVILGLSTCNHPLLTERGFYVVDGVNRLFTMPFSVKDPNDPTSRQLCMWQLSFSGLSEGEAILLKRAGSKAQMEEAKHRTAGWMAPVAEMLLQSDMSEVWATPLYDRPPMQLPRSRRRNWKVSRDGGDVASCDVGGCGDRSDISLSGRVTVLGDACHPMSMFKGQGANQALQDGPLLASWLTKGGKQAALDLEGRVMQFEREMVGRTSPRVAASFEACQLLHSPEVLRTEFGVEGLSSEESRAFLALLRDKGIKAPMEAEDLGSEKAERVQQSASLEVQALAVLKEMRRHKRD